MKHKPAKDTSRLDTEQPNPASRNLDQRSALEIAQILNAEDAKVAAAVRRALPQIARAIDVIAAALGNGGRLIYVGSGTSGRLGALDAAECPPTFGTRRKLVQYVIAGGAKALGAAVEANEDSAAYGRADLVKRRPTEKDVVVGISASGRTPYTRGALRYAVTRCAATIAVTCNRHSALERAADIAIVVPVGPEALTGSTRLKAGTAQKMVLNMLSTGAMARLGYIYGNLMINVPLKNSKLSARGIEVLQLATGLDRKRSLQLLRATEGNVPLAVVMAKRKVDRSTAVEILAQARGHMRRALQEK